MADDQCARVPLAEQLRSIPLEAVLRIDTPNPLGWDTRSIPVGRLCHEAAEALGVPACPKCGGSGWKPNRDANGETIWTPLMNDALPCECGALARRIAAEKAEVEYRSWFPVAPLCSICDQPGGRYRWVMSREHAACDRCFIAWYEGAGTDRDSIRKSLGIDVVPASDESKGGT